MRTKTLKQRLKEMKQLAEDCMEEDWYEEFNRGILYAISELEDFV